MANWIRIISILLIVVIAAFAFNTISNKFTQKNMYVPIIKPSNNSVNVQSDLKIEISDFLPSKALTPSITITPTPTQNIMITEKPMITNTQIPKSRISVLKSSDYSKVLSCENGFEAHELAFDPNNLDLGSDYYYGGDYAVFKIDLINVGNRVIINPASKIYVNTNIFNTEIYRKKLDLILKPGDNKLMCFDFNVPYITGFYKLKINLYDDNNVLLLSFYKEINIL